MPTKREREYYRLGFEDGLRHSKGVGGDYPISEGQIVREIMGGAGLTSRIVPKKRKLSAWNKFVKANSNKPRFRFARSTGQYKKGQLNLKKMAVAFRKTPAGRKKRR